MSEATAPELASRPATRKVVRSSDVAKLLAKPVLADEAGMAFGKAFEEAYTKYAWFCQRDDKPTTLSAFKSLMGDELKRSGILTRANLMKGAKMCRALREAGAVGSKPSTRFMQLAPGVMLAAQPDLFDIATGVVTEFKTYPINDYAIAQSRVFAYVCGRPIRLVGLAKDDDGSYTAQECMVTADGLVLPEIPERLFVEQEWCDVCGRPVANCKCYELGTDWRNDLG